MARSVRVRGIVEIRGLGADSTLSQEYPGIADSDNMGDVCDFCPMDDLNDVDGDKWCCPQDNCCNMFNR